jgi:plastocyanin
MAHPLRACAFLLLLVWPVPFLAGCTAGTRGDEAQVSGAAAAPQAAPGNLKEAKPKTAPNQVVIDNFRFSPAQLTVKAGTKVTWVNRDDLPHTVTSSVKPRLFDSGTLDTDEGFAHVFDRPGTYEYFCALHPKMTGRIVVK